MSWSWPFHSFHRLHFPCLSRSFVASHFLTSPVVPIGFLVLCFRFCPFHVPVPLCFPFTSPCFPVMSTSYFLPSFPCTSLRFPFAPQYFPQQNTVVPAFSQKGSQTTQSFPQKEAGNPNQQRAGREIRAWDPFFATPAPRRLRLVERHQINFLGGPLSSLRYPTRLRNVGGFCIGHLGKGARPAAKRSLQTPRAACKVVALPEQAREIAIDRARVRSSAGTRPNSGQWFWGGQEPATWHSL